MPRSFGRRRFSSQNVEIAVIGANFVKGILRAVPLVQDLFDQVLVPIKSKTNRSFVRRPTGVALYLQLHILRLAHNDDPQIGQAVFIFFLRCAHRCFASSDRRWRVAALMWRAGAAFFAGEAFFRRAHIAFAASEIRLRPAALMRRRPRFVTAAVLATETPVIGEAAI